MNLLSFLLDVFKTQKMNKKMNVFCKIILPLLCIISCSKRKEADNTMVLEKNHTFFLWNNDSLGCKHERTIEMGEELYNTFKKSNKNDSILLKEYLGTPNRKFKDKEEIVFMYLILVVIMVSY